MDAGAVRAVRERSKSLFSAGIVRVAGEFAAQVGARPQARKEKNPVRALPHTRMGARALLLVASQQTTSWLVASAQYLLTSSCV